jgi:PAS domain S-box-containing protein
MTGSRVLNLLYIDDEPELLELGRLFLEKIGDFSVTTALSGRSGLEELAQHEFDAIVSDFQMPEMDGIELLKIVRKSFGNIPFIIFTGRGREEVVIEALNNGADFYIRRGGDPGTQFADLAHRIRQAVSRRRTEIALLDSEKRLSDLINSLPDATFAIDRDGKLITWNRAIEKMTGVAAADILGKSDYEYALSFYGKLCPPILTDLISGPGAEPGGDYARVTRDGETLSAETDLFQVRGKRIYILAKAGPVYNRQGEIVGAVETIRDITDRKKIDDELRAAYDQITTSQEQLQQKLVELTTTQAALRISEEKFRDIVETSPDPIWELNTDGVITYVSPPSTDLTGYTPEEIIGRPVFSFVHGDALLPFRETFFASVRTKKPPEEFELPIRCRDGHIIIMGIRAVAHLDGDGRLIGFRGVARDITERKHSEEALRESEEKYRALVETTSDFIWEIDANDTYVYVSPKVRDMLRYEPDELMGKTPFDLMPPDEAERMAADFHRHAASRLPLVSVENRAIRKDGLEVTLETSAVVLAGKDGSYHGYRGIDRDITGRVRAERALRESLEWIRTILNTAQVCIVLVDADIHRIIDANPMALKLLGLSRDEVIGADCQKIICLAEGCTCPASGGEQMTDTSEHVLISASGARIPVLRTVVPVSISGRSVLVESFVDISGQKRSEAAIREANRKLNLLNSITRHDIRNQLTVAQGYTQLAALSKPEGVVTNFLTKINSALAMIQRQIEFTRAYQDLGVHSPAWFPVGEIISNGKPDTIALRNTCNDVEVFADPMINKVFLNLFDNAVKHGMRVTAVTVGCEEREGGLVITFADNGCGIALGRKQKIFEKGYGEGTGLGLYLAREILAITGITIQETGTPGRGAVFEITVPQGAYRKIT